MRFPQIRLRQPYKSWFYTALGIAAFIAVCIFSPARVLFDETFLVHTFNGLGVYGAPAFVLLSTISISLGFPGNVLAVASGAVFGFVWGTIWSLLGATLGAVGAFLIARILLHRWAEKRFQHNSWLRRINHAIANHPMIYILLVRFTPLSPFSLVNFLFGLTPVDLKTYTIGTFLGLIPLYATYNWLGVTGKQALQGGDRIPFALALGALTLLTVLPLLKKKQPTPDVSGDRELSSVNANSLHE